MIMLPFLKPATKQNIKPGKCVIIFLFLFVPLLLVSISLKYYSQIFFQTSLFFTGWFALTFSEYMTHRFAMHKKNKKASSFDFNHAHHHSHPNDIKISGLQRFLLLVSSVILAVISILMNNYFTLLAGFICGFPIYALMHFFIHQKITQKVFRKLVKYHIYHHCKYPDKCFGISVTWWDDILGTVPVNAEPISAQDNKFLLQQRN